MINGKTFHKELFIKILYYRTVQFISPLEITRFYQFVRKKLFITLNKLKDDHHDAHDVLLQSYKVFTNLLLYTDHLLGFI